MGDVAGAAAGGGGEVKVKIMRARAASLSAQRSPRPRRWIGGGVVGISFLLSLLRGRRGVGCI